MAKLPCVTVPEIARQSGEPVWKIRRVVDSLGPIARLGFVRLVPRERVPEIIALSQARRRIGPNR